MVVTHESEASDKVLSKDTGNFRFLNLPVEIRLLIYGELLASRSDDRYLLCSCDSCQQNTKIDKDHGLRGEVTLLFQQSYGLVNWFTTKPSQFFTGRIS